MSTMTVRATAAAGAVAMVIDPDVPAFQLEEIRVTLDGVGTAGTLTVTLDSGLGATYDNLIYSQDMTAVRYIDYMGPRPQRFTHPDDRLLIAWANANNCEYGIEVFFSPI